MIYDNVVELMAKKDLTIHSLEMKAGLANGTIRKWKDPAISPNIKNVIAVAGVLGVSVSRLLRP